MAKRGRIMDKDVYGVTRTPEGIMEGIVRYGNKELSVVKLRGNSEWIVIPRGKSD